MKRSPVTRIPVNRKLPFAVFHESGKQLHKIGEELNRSHLHLLREANIRNVVTASRLEKAERIESELTVKPVKVAGLGRGDFIARPIFDEKGQLVVDSGTAVTEDTIGFLLRNHIEDVWVKKSDNELHLEQVSAYKKLLKKHIEDGEPIPNFTDDTTMDQFADLARDLVIVNQLETALANRLRVHVQGDPLMHKLPPLNPDYQRPPAEVEAQLKGYNICAKAIENMYRKMAGGEKVQLSDIEQIVMGILKLALRDRVLLTAIMHQPRDGEYLFHHTMNVVTLTVTLAILLGYDRKLLMDAAYAAFFNDAGMLLVPDAIRNKPGQLTAAELSEIRNHTTYSVRLCLRVANIPPILPLVIFQSQELLDGSGYPRHRKAEQVHDLAKVVAVADLYSAMISNRPHRKGVMPAQAIQTVLQLTQQRKYDAITVRALLRGINVFPVGTWVEMSGDNIGVVVSPNPDEVSRPYVRVAMNNGQPVAGFPLVIIGGKSGITVQRAVEQPEGYDALDAFKLPG